MVSRKERLVYFLLAFPVQTTPRKVSVLHCLAHVFLENRRDLEVALGTFYTKPECKLRLRGDGGMLGAQGCPGLGIGSPGALSLSSASSCLSAALGGLTLGACLCSSPEMETLHQLGGPAPGSRDQVFLQTSKQESRRKWDTPGKHSELPEGNS